MMPTTPVLRLSREQAEQLATYCSLYRAYMWRTMSPSPERNQTLRAIQSLQGRLMACKGQERERVTVLVTTEEGNGLRQMLTKLLELYRTELPSSERTQVLGELAALRGLVERALRPSGNNEMEHAQAKRSKFHG